MYDYNEKKQGRLFYNSYLDRMDIDFDDGTQYGGLHCGDTLDVLVNPIKREWESVRMEYNDDQGWYLVGCHSPEFDLIVRK